VNKQQLTPVSEKRVGAYFICLSLIMRSSEGTTRQRGLDGGFCTKDIQYVSVLIVSGRYDSLIC
jgi:hypothetical protein